MSPDRLSQVAPGYDFCELTVVDALNPTLDDAAFAPEAARLAQMIPHVRAFNVFLPGDLKIVGPQVDWEGVERYATRAIARAAALGGEIVVFGSGRARMIPEHFARALAWGQLVRFVDLCADVAELHGITIAIEPLNHTESNVLNSYLEGVELAKDVDRPRTVRVLADIYHFMMDAEPVDDLLKAPEWLAHVHLADTGRRFPGSGVYPNERLLAILQEIGYCGRVSVECSWGDDLTDESRRALAFLRSLTS
jgi:sugar phosphate isomerase/epimerase